MEELSLENSPTAHQRTYRYYDSTSASDDVGTVRKLTVNLHMNLLYFRRTVSFLTTVAWKVSPDSEFSQYWLKLQWIK